MSLEVLTELRVDSGWMWKGFETTGLEAVARVEKKLLSTDDPCSIDHRLPNPPWLQMSCYSCLSCNLRLAPPLESSPAAWPREAF